MSFTANYLNRFFYVYFSIVMGCIVQSCTTEREECFFLDNTKSTKVESLESFTHFYSHLEGNYTFKQGEKYQIEISGEKRYVDSLKVNTSHSVLTLKNHMPICSSSVPFEIVVTVPQLQHISILRESQVKIDDFTDQEELTIDLTDNSQLEIGTLTGLKRLSIAMSQNASIKSIQQFSPLDELSVNIEGNGHFNGYTIPAKNVSITIEGKGYCEVNSIEKLSVVIMGEANVISKGNPSLYKRITGKGDVYFTD